MDKLDLALVKLWQVEFSNEAARFLHTNKTEDYLTLGGIAEKYHKHDIDWSFVKRLLELCDNSITRASRMLYADRDIKNSVKKIYKTQYFDKMKLESLDSQKMINEIFLFGVHTGVKNASKTAQRVVGTLDDGFIGKVSINALNRYDDNRFDSEFDELELAYYKNIINRNDNMKIYLNGFKNRSAFV